MEVSVGNSERGPSRARKQAEQEFELWGEVVYYDGAPHRDRERHSGRRNPRSVPGWVLVKASVEAFLLDQYGQDGLIKAKRRWANFTFVQAPNGEWVKVYPDVPGWLLSDTRRYVGRYAALRIARPSAESQKRAHVVGVWQDEK